METCQQINRDPGYPPVNSYTKTLQVTRAAFATGRTKKISFREKQLKNLLRLFEENGEKILQALYKDLRKSKEEATMFELELCKTEIKYMLKHLREYAADEELPFNWLTILDKAYVRKEPYGTVLIIGPWNYPFPLTIKPLVGAIAAGNCAVIKPSEVAAESAKTLAQLLPQYIDPECYPVVLADAEQTKSLLENKFDYIFYTGSTSVGSSILHQAAPHLTPVTLELGGKSPCYIDDNVDFHRAASRIMWGKILNMGQTCIAPDYLLCSERAQRAFVTSLGQILKQWYGVGSLQKKSEIPRIINHRHFLRLKRLLETTKGSIVFGGQMDEQDLWIEPTIVTDVAADDPLLGEEIFGPILPIVKVKSPDEAIDFILAKPKPLALYVFSRNDKTVEKILTSTSSGSSCVNDVNLQNGLRGLPFGGVGASGMGSYHGKFSFDTFSHKRGILVRGIGYVSEKMGEIRYAPYSNYKLALITFLLHYFNSFDVKCTLKGAFTHFLALILGAAILFLVLHFEYNVFANNCEAPVLQFPKSDQFVKTD